MTRIMRLSGSESSGTAGSGLKCVDNQSSVIPATMFAMPYNRLRRQNNLLFLKHRVSLIDHRWARLFHPLLRAVPSMSFFKKDLPQENRMLNELRQRCG